MNEDNQILSLAWEIVSSEFTDNWVFFLSHFWWTFSSIDDAKITAINDWNKNLNSALTAEFSHAIHAYCCYHLQENLMKLHSGGEVRELFWQATEAQSKSQFEEHLETIQKLHTAAADYLQKISSQYWSKHAISDSQYDHCISNIAESLNFSWLNIQNLSILAILQDI